RCARAGGALRLLGRHHLYHRAGAAHVERRPACAPVHLRRGWQMTTAARDLAILARGSRQAAITLALGALIVFFGLGYAAWRVEALVRAKKAEAAALDQQLQSLNQQIAALRTQRQQL